MAKNDKACLPQNESHSAGKWPLKSEAPVQRALESPKPGAPTVKADK